MKSHEAIIIKERKKVFSKFLPVKLKPGKSMDEKLAYAKTVSASIKGFKEAK